jgi:hypothetical protein
MVQLAVHDALNAIDRWYEPYLYEAWAESGAAPAAAIAAASREVLAGVVPSFGTEAQREKALAMLERAYTVALEQILDGPAKEAGIAVGQMAARAMPTARQADGAMATPAYTPGTAPGQWQPHPNPVPPNPPIAIPAMAAGNLAALLPQWALVTPFTMVTPWQFRLPGPPVLDSSTYARDYDEVKRLGVKDSAEPRAVDHWEHARLLALVNVVIDAGYIAGADTRYLYNFWRPITAIRSGDTDGNDATIGAPTWESFLNTPPLPDRPRIASPEGPPRRCSPASSRPTRSPSR